MVTTITLAATATPRIRNDMVAILIVTRRQVTKTTRRRSTAMTAVVVAIVISSTIRMHQEIGAITNTVICSHAIMGEATSITKITRASTEVVTQVEQTGIEVPLEISTIEPPFSCTVSQHFIYAHECPKFIFIQRSERIEEQSLNELNICCKLYEAGLAILWI